MPTASDLEKASLNQNEIRTLNFHLTSCCMKVSNTIAIPKFCLWNSRFIKMRFVCGDITIYIKIKYS